MKKTGVRRTEAEWVALAKRRAMNILGKHRVTFHRHLEMKIAEAGPANQRVEPVLLTRAVAELKAEGIIEVCDRHKQMEFLVAAKADKRGLHKRIERIKQLYDDYEKCAQLEHYCGLHFEKLLFETVLQMTDIYHINGSGPTPDKNGKLRKVSGAETLFFNGKAVYGGAGFDLFLIHKATGIPIGVEAKNVRKWLYPDAPEIWKAIARACTLECLPVIAARKFAYTTRARLFSQVGVLGFESQFQYFSPDVHEISTKFPDIMHKDGLGYADIKITDEIPSHFIHFFRDILPEHISDYYEMFMQNNDLLAAYAIDAQLAEEKTRSRNSLYRQFEQELLYGDAESAAADDDDNAPDIEREDE